MPVDGPAFAAAWERAWNSHDLEVILSHYRDDVAFRSQKALALAGQGEVRGKDALRAYWAAALERQPDLKFTVQQVFEGFDMLVISYRNHRGALAAETLYFDADGLVYRGAACHAPAAG